jgi:hypothetical protein
MNVVQVASILAPLGGALGGLAAADCQSPVLHLVAAVAGFTTGALVHPGPMLLASRLAELGVRSSQHLAATRSRSTPWWGVGIVAYAMASPVLGALLSRFAVKWMIAHFI